MKPSRRALYLALFLFLFTFFTPTGHLVLETWKLLTVLFLLVATVDLALVLRRPQPETRRIVSHTLPLGVWSQVSLKLFHRGKKPVFIKVHDFHPASMKVRDQPRETILAPDTEVELPYRVQPVERGLFQFLPTHILVKSPLGLWWRSCRSGEASEVRVYPNFQAVAGYALLATNQRLTQIGIHRRQRRGEGREFHQMREFVQGDSMRQIDWKASSRMRKLISREFEDARDQQVVFLLDCGQTMRSQDGDLSHFDHALNAVLLMTHVALRHGDAVGLMTFSGDHRWLSARKGKAQMNLILNKTFDIQPSLHTSDFINVARNALVNLKKRSLIILVTNIRDEDGGDLADALKMLKKKHLVLLTSMRERVLHDVADGPLVKFEDSLRVAATHAYLSKRRDVYNQLQARGVYCVDTIPEHLPISMINSYLDIKSQGVL